MTQAILSPTNVDKMKMSFDAVFCDADVDTLMQIGNNKAAPLNNADRFKPNIEDVKQSKDITDLKKQETSTRKQKKRKSRRGRNKSGRQLQYNEHHTLSEDYVQIKRRSQKLRRMVAPAPYNTNQFLMSDHKSELVDTNYNDSDKEPDFENQFAKREFFKEYEKVVGNKQNTPINRLIDDYLLIETEVKELERKYQEMTAQEQLKARLGAVEYDWEKGEIAMEPEVAEKIKIFHDEIAKIRDENQLLENENLRFRSSESDSSSSSSSDESSSDSDDSSGSDTSSSDENSDDNEDIPEPTSTEEVLGNCVKSDLEQRREDTGYESSGSSNDVTKVTSTTIRK